MAGYYGEGKGAGEGAGDNQAHWDREALRVGRAMEELARLVGDIEAGIEEAGAALRISQPPMHGKYDVRWWMTDGVKHPVLVRWMLREKKNGRRYEPKKVLRVSSVRNDRAFEVNHQETVKLLEIAQGLISAREEAAGCFGKTRRSAEAQMKSKSLWLANERAKVNMIKAKVVKNLVRAGYEVEPKLLEEAGL